MPEKASPSPARNGKWLVILIVGGGILLAIIASRFTKWRTLMPEPATQPTR
jgi:hypothetical protein